MTKKITPRLVARWNIPKGNPPARIYFHESGIQTFSGKAPEEPATMVLETEEDLYYYSCRGADAVSRANEYVRAFMKNWFSVDTSAFQYLVGVLWGDKEKTRLFDFFGFGSLPNQEDNAEITPFCLKNGVLIPERGGGILTPKYCGDGAIVQGVEEKYRRRCKNMGQFRLHPPKIRVRDELVDIVIK